jgi:hypothetical protein
MNTDEVTESCVREEITGGLRPSSALAVDINVMVFFELLKARENLIHGNIESTVNVPLIKLIRSSDV